MPAQSQKFFRVIYLDDANRTFGISAIVSDDNGVTRRTTDLQDKGSQIRIVTTTPVTDLHDVPSIETIRAGQSPSYRYDPTLRW